MFIHYQDNEYAHKSNRTSGKGEGRTYKGDDSKTAGFQIQYAHRKFEYYYFCFFQPLKISLLISIIACHTRMWKGQRKSAKCFCYFAYSTGSDTIQFFFQLSYISSVSEPVEYAKWQKHYACRILNLHTKRLRLDQCIDLQRKTNKNIRLMIIEFGWLNSKWNGKKQTAGTKWNMDRIFFVNAFGTYLLLILSVNVTFEKQKSRWVCNKYIIDILHILVNWSRFDGAPHRNVHIQTEIYWERYIDRCRSAEYWHTHTHTHTHDYYLWMHICTIALRLHTHTHTFTSICHMYARVTVSFSITEHAEERALILLRICWILQTATKKSLQLEFCSIFVFFFRFVCVVFINSD